MKTYQIKLGDQTYTCHPFNLGELEAIGDQIGDMTARKAGFQLLRMVLKRADPPVPDPDVLEASPAELTAAIKAVMAGTGFKGPEDEPGEAPVATGG